ncbi:MAG: DUF4388 domain-containing protein [Kofleriaceae bacterium]
MSKQSLLLVDGDTRSLRVLEVSLRKAGFTVTPASSVADALDKLELDTPDLIISETKFPTDLDGFELRRRVRSSPDWAAIPFVFLTAETAIEHKIRGLELGVDDYLTKPIYIKEIVTRINILLQKRQRAHFEERKDGVRFAGRVADMPVVDVIQTIEVSRKSGVIQFVADRQRTAAIYFRDGRVIDAEAGTLQGEDAVYRLLTWSEGEFEVVFRTVRRREVITTSSQGLLMEGMRRLDEWSRLLEQLPPLTHRFEIDTPELAARLGEVPDDNNPILRLVDGKRSLLEVIDASDFGDLECLQAITRLYFEGLLVDLEPEQRPKRDTGKPMPLVIIESAPTPIEEVASGPLALDRENHIIEEITPPPKAPPQEVDDPVFAGENDAELARSQSVEIGDAEVLSEEDLPGPLSGGYRQSSLRLIDEAVAAAQMIDPSFLADEPNNTDPRPLARIPLQPVQPRESDPRIENARGVIERDGAVRGKPTSVPPGIKNAILRADASAEIPMPSEEIEDDDSGVPQMIESENEPSEPHRFDDPEEPTEPERPPFVAKRDPTGRRMTSSHGHDRAETSGELHVSQRDSLEPAHERELVTILPRRITREVPIVTGAPTSTAHEAPPATGSSVTTVTLAPRPSSPPHRLPLAGGVVRKSGPGPVVMVLVVLASLMAGMAVYLAVRKYRHRATVAVREDAGEIRRGTVDAEAVAVAPEPDAALRVAALDAGVPVDAPIRVAAIDAGIRTVAADAGIDRNKEASLLKDQAVAALEDGDPDRALELADQSLKLRRTSHAYLVKARALQRSGKTDAAIEAATSARDLAPGYYLTHHELGMILMSARRNAEARPELEKYLELAPNDRDAATVRQLLAAPTSP